MEKSKEKITTKTKEEFLTRGTGNFYNCTDYDDALKAMQKYSDSQNASMLERVEKLEMAMNKAIDAIGHSLATGAKASANDAFIILKTGLNQTP